MFKHFKVSTRLYLVLICALGFILTLSGIGIFSTVSSTQALHEAVEINALAVEVSQQLHVDMLTLRKYEKDTFLTISESSKANEYASKWNETYSLTKKRLQTLRELLTEYPMSVKNAKTLEDIALNLDGYSSGFKDVVQRSQSGQIASPEEANSALSSVKENIRVSELAVVELSKTIETYMAGQNLAAIHNLETIRRALIGVALFAFVFSSLFMFFVVHSILKPLKMFNTALRDVSQGDGDLTYRFQLDTQDELGEMAKHLNETWEKLDTLIATIVENSVLVEASAGALSIEAHRILHGTRQVTS